MKILLMLIMVFLTGCACVRPYPSSYIIAEKRDEKMLLPK